VASRGRRPTLADDGSRVVATDTHPSRPGRHAFVASLAVGQLISWGTLFYAITFLAAPIERAEGWSRPATFGVFSLALLVAAVCALGAARAMARWGSRWVLTAASILAAVAFSGMAAARSVGAFAAAWVIAGATMSVLLYEGAFAALRDRTDLDFRRSVTTLTVVGGLASTAFWPLTRVAVDAVGWRGTAVGFGLLHLCIAAPIHAWALRGLRRVSPAPGPADGPGAPDVPASTVAPPNDPRIRWLATSFALAAFVSGALAAHLDTLFTALGVAPRWVLAAAVSFGPLQTLGRVLDLVTRGAWSWRRLGTGLLALQAIALSSLFLVPRAPWWAVPFAASFGLANGLMTLVRPLAVADRREGDPAGFKSDLFLVSSAALFARAVAPLAVAFALGWSGARAVLWAFASTGVLAWLAFRRALAEKPA
jgi:hypothetical protein